MVPAPLDLEAGSKRLKNKSKATVKHEIGYNCVHVGIFAVAVLGNPYSGSSHFDQIGVRGVLERDI